MKNNYRKIYSITHWKTQVKEFGIDQNTIFSPPIHIGYLPDEFVVKYEHTEHGTKKIRNRHDIAKNTVEKVVSQLNLLSSLNNIKTIHRLSNISLSRDKVKIWCEKNNCKVTRDINKADLIIYSNDTVKNLITSNWYNAFKTINEIIPSIQNLHNELKFNKCTLDDMLLMFANIEDDAIIQVTHSYDYYSRDSVVLNANYTDKYNDWHKTNNSNATDNELFCLYGHNEYIETQNWNEYTKLYSGKFMLDTMANKLMSNDSVIFDDEMYINIKNMIKSGNKEDVTIAMSTIANCNIEESKTYIAILFFHFNEDFFKHNKLYTSTVFKSIRKSFQKYGDLKWNRQHTSSYTSLIEHLIEDDALTVKVLEHILDLVYENVIVKSTGLKRSAFIINRASITLCDELQEKVNKRPNKNLIHNELSTNDLPF